MGMFSMHLHIFSPQIAVQYISYSKGPCFDLNMGTGYTIAMIHFSPLL